MSEQPRLVAGAIIGLVIGPIVGAIIGVLGLTIIGGALPTSAIIIVWVIVGTLGGIAGGVFGTLREFRWKMSPVMRSTIGALAGAIGWVGALTVIATILFVIV
jgi:hypothetical protein